MRHFLARPGIEKVFAGCRDPDRAEALQAASAEASGRLKVFPCDLIDEASIADFAASVSQHTDRAHWLVNAAGILHDDAGLQPERRLDHVTPEQLHKVFAVNAFGPLLVTKHLHKLYAHDERAVLAHLSARVGSIGDNRLGGWYGYRASKSALNQLVRSMSIELRRKNKQTVCVAIHPGTVDTPLTKPFQKSAKVLFTADDSVARMMAVLDGLDPADSGGFFAYDGTAIEW